MSNCIALGPDYDNHAIPEKADGHHPSFTVVEAVVFLLDSNASQNLRRVHEIQPAFEKCRLALRWIEADFHMPLNMLEVNYCIYKKVALPGAILGRKQLVHILRDDPLMAPSEDAGEDIAIRRRRVRYRAWHRGTREMDLVLGPFADAHLDAFGAPELDRLEALMDEEDTDLLKWVMGQEPVPGCADAELLGRIIAYRLRTA